MATIDHQAELTRAGANVNSTWSRLTYYARRYPLGAAGLLIVIVFVIDRDLRPGLHELRSDQRPTRAPRSPSPAAPICSAPTSWAATCGPASSTAPASR